MAKPDHIELYGGVRIPILFENRTVFIIDKPAGWLLGPDAPVGNRKNIQLALESSIRNGDYWAASRNLKFLRFVHRLDADTSGILMFSKNMGAMRPLSALFANRQVEKLYLTVVDGVPEQDQWICRLPLGPDPEVHGRHRVDPAGKATETHFHVLRRGQAKTIVLVRPVTGRTHQIRVHLLAAGVPVEGDRFYGRGTWKTPLALRAIKLAFIDPFQRRPISVTASIDALVKEHGFDPAGLAEQIRQVKFAPAGPPQRDEEEEDEEPETPEPARREDPPPRPFNRPYARPGSRPDVRPAGRPSARPPMRPPARPSSPRRALPQTRRPRHGS